MQSDMRSSLLSAALALFVVSCAEKPYGAIPSAGQLEWQAMEMNMFCHF